MCQAAGQHPIDLDWSTSPWAPWKGQRAPWKWLGWEGTQEECRRGCSTNAGTVRHPGEMWEGFITFPWWQGVEGWCCGLLAASETSIYRALGDAQKQGATQARNVITKDMI